MSMVNFYESMVNFPVILYSLVKQNSPFSINVNSQFLRVNGQFPNYSKFTREVNSRFSIMPIVNFCESMVNFPVTLHSLVKQNSPFTIDTILFSLSCI